MSRVDFDQYAGQYEAILAAQTNFFCGFVYFARYKIELAQQQPGRPGHIRSSTSVAASAAACRTGAKSSRKPKSSAAILLPKVLSLHAGRTRACRFASMDELGPDAKFDLVIASCVFHHIPPQDRQTAIRYCYSRLNEGGQFIIFEHNPINPVTRHLVNTCPSTRTRCC